MDIPVIPVIFVAALAMFALAVRLTALVLLRLADSGATKPPIVNESNDDTIILPGTFPVDRLPELGIARSEGRYTTVAGLALDRLGRIPDAPGDVVRIDGWDLEVADVEGRAITRVLLRPTVLADQ